MAGDNSPAEGGGEPPAAGMAADVVGSTDTTLANADAERALLRLKQKLGGLEGGTLMAGHRQLQNILGP